jgi:SAM-dependent methyltransferase
MATHKWLIERVAREEVRRNAIHCHGDLLDVGCGEKPYEAIIRRYVRSYTGLDHLDTLHSHRADVWGDAMALPFDDLSFDTVVMFQVLEHLPEPATALLEAHRVLRSGGLILVTTPFMWGLHEQPLDFYRYTPFGLEHLLRKAGFDDITIEQVGGYWLTAGLRFSYYLQAWASGAWWRRYLVPPFQHAAQFVAATLNHFDDSDTDATGYTTRAWKH